MKTFTSSLPNDLLKQLSEVAKKYQLPKNKIIEKALSVYLDQLKRAEYVKSYEKAGKDKKVMQIAQEGMEEYLRNIAE